MSTNKDFDKVVCFILCICIVVASLSFFIEDMGVTASQNSNQYTQTLFGDLKINTMNIIVNEDNWKNMLLNASDKEYINSTIVINNEAFTNVAIRPKGNSSLQQVQSSDSDRYSFKIEFDHYDSTKTYHGLDKLTLNNIIQDTTYMKDYLLYTLMGEFGVSSPLVNFVDLYVNGESVGFYLAVEAIEESFLQRNYGNNYGIAYKPETEGGMGQGNDKMPDIDEMREKAPDLFDDNGDLRDMNEIMGILPGIMEENGIDMPDTMPGMMSQAQGEIPNQMQDEQSQALGERPNQMQGEQSQAQGERPNQMQGEQSQALGERPNQMQGEQSQVLGEIPNQMKGEQSQALGELSNQMQGEQSQALGERPNQMQGEQSQAQGEIPNQMQGEAQNERPNQQGGGMQGGMSGSISNALEYTDDSYDSYSYIFDNSAINISNNDKSRLIASIKQLSEQQNLEQVLNIEQVIRYFVVHNFALNFDSYTGSIMHNYYLYEKNGVMEMLPWDYNLSFASFMTTYTTEQLINYPIDTPITSGTIEQRPMLSWIFSNDEYTRLYHEIFAEFIEEMFDTNYVVDLITETQVLIAPYVESDPTQFYSYDEFVKGVDTLKEVVTLRAESISKQLTGEIPSTTDGQTLDNSNLVDTSHIEITDTGSTEMGGQTQGDKSKGENTQGNKTEINQMQDNQMQGNQMQGNQMQGNQMQGNQMQGNQMQGNQMQGNQMQGNQMQGNQMQGNQMQDNQMQGNQMQGNQMQGNQMLPQGGMMGVQSENYTIQNTNNTQMLIVSIVTLILSLFLLSFYKKRRF